MVRYNLYKRGLEFAIPGSRYNFFRDQYYGCTISSRFHHLFHHLPNLNTSFKYILIDVLTNATKFIQFRLFVFT